MQSTETHLTKKIRSEVGANRLLGVTTAVQAASDLVEVTKALVSRCGKTIDDFAD